MGSYAPSGLRRQLTYLPTAHAVGYYLSPASRFIDEEHGRYVERLS